MTPETLGALSQGELVSLVVGLVEDNQRLAAEVASLKAELAKNSGNSSKPPSRDPAVERGRQAEARRAKRSKGGQRRKPGKQPGAAGKTLEMAENPDEIVTHEPTQCSGCGAGLGETDELVGTRRRQVVDLPEPKAVVTEHQARTRRCGCCGAETAASFPAHVRAPVSYGPEVRALGLYLLDRQHLPYERAAELIEDVLGVKVSTGWLCALQEEAAKLLGPFIVRLKALLGEADVLCADETGTAVGTTKHWVHTVTTGVLTLLAVHPNRGRQALEDIGVLGAYAGVLMHDGYASYDYLCAAHAQCHAHLVRHLKDVGQTDAYKAWTTDLAGVLFDAKVAAEAAAAKGRAKVGRIKAKRIRQRYDACLDAAFALLPEGEPPRRRHQGGWSIYQRQAWNLATRMRRDRPDILRLLDDTTIPADNNAAERSLRMVKVHDKVSGTFHSLDVAKAFADVRSYIQTGAQNGLNRLDILRQLFTDGPWIPPSPANTG